MPTRGRDGTRPAVSGRTVIWWKRQRRREDGQLGLVLTRRDSSAGREPPRALPGHPVPWPDTPLIVGEGRGEAGGHKSSAQVVQFILRDVDPKRLDEGVHAASFRL
jgi:hypothetical protein